MCGCTSPMQEFYLNLIHIWTPVISPLQWSLPTATLVLWRYMAPNFCSRKLWFFTSNPCFFYSGHQLLALCLRLVFGSKISCWFSFCSSEDRKDDFQAPCMLVLKAPPPFSNVVILKSKHLIPLSNRHTILKFSPLRSLTGPLSASCCLSWFSSFAAGFFM